MKAGDRADNGLFLAAKVLGKEKLCIDIDDEDEDELLSDNDSDEDENVDEINELETGGENWLIKFVQKMQVNKTSIVTLNDSYKPIVTLKTKAKYTGGSVANMYKKAVKAKKFKNATEDSKNHGQQMLTSFRLSTTGDHNILII